MPRVPNRLRQIGANVLGIGTTTQTRGAQNTPFVESLTDDGASDTNFNEDYSAAPVDAYWTAASDAVITFASLCVGDSDVAQFTTLSGSSRFIGNLNALTNGLIFCVKNGSSAVVQYLTPTATNLKTMNDLASWGTHCFLGFYALDATSTNNYAYLVVYNDFQEAFGGGLYIPAGHSFVCILNDNFSTLSTLTVNISGYYL